MVLVFVPEGEFLMGASSADPEAFDNEKPQHNVYLEAYWIDSTEVTNAMYALCVADGACTPPGEDASFSRSPYYSHPTCAGYPVIQVTWQQAQDYCEWAGRRLPTEAEWEKAARGTDGRIYPWGNQPPDGTRANLCGSECPNEANVPSIDDGFFDTAPVGTYPAGASPYGALDMAGNVWEWVADWWQPDYYATSPTVNPSGPSNGDTSVARGGSFANPPTGIRTTVRASLLPTASTAEFGGFRCAISTGD
ncbi:MAG: SUMF1/EgtB/PvdO family nonheme iron enzyme [Chloroflexota bacterium]